MPLLGLLGIVFITLKLLDVIAWSWWLVLLPIYGPFILVAVLFVFGVSLASMFVRKPFRSRTTPRRR